MPKQISAGFVGVDQQRHALARIGHALVDGDAAAVTSAALHIVRDEMVGHRVEHALRDLRAGGVVQEDEVAGLLQGREHGPDRSRPGKVAACALGLMLVHVNVLGCVAKMESNGDRASQRVLAVLNLRSSRPTRRTIGHRKSR